MSDRNSAHPSVPHHMPRALGNRCAERAWSPPPPVRLLPRPLWPLLSWQFPLDGLAASLRAAAPFPHFLPNAFLNLWPEVPSHFSPHFPHYYQGAVRFLIPPPQQQVTRCQLLPSIVSKCFRDTISKLQHEEKHYDDLHFTGGDTDPEGLKPTGQNDTSRKQQS